MSPLSFAAALTGLREKPLPNANKVDHDDYLANTDVLASIDLASLLIKAAPPIAVRAFRAIFEGKTPARQAPLTPTHSIASNERQSVSAGGSLRRSSMTPVVLADARPTSFPYLSDDVAQAVKEENTPIIKSKQNINDKPSNDAMYPRNEGIIIVDDGADEMAVSERKPAVEQPVLADLPPEVEQVRQNDLQQILPFAQKYSAMEQSVQDYQELTRKLLSSSTSKDADLEHVGAKDLALFLDAYIQDRETRLAEKDDLNAKLQASIAGLKESTEETLAVLPSMHAMSELVKDLKRENAEQASILERLKEQGTNEFDADEDPLVRKAQEILHRLRHLNTHQGRRLAKLREFVREEQASSSTST